MNDEQLKEFNNALTSDLPAFDVQGGFKTILRGLVTYLPELYGENTAKNFCYQLGGTPGAKIGELILKDHDGECYDDPIEALTEFGMRLKSYYRIQIIEANHQDNGEVLSKISLITYMDALFENDPSMDISQNILFNITKGYLERSLKKLTNYKVAIKYLERQGKVNILALKFTK